jgi:hypothetical protein
MNAITTASAASAPTNTIVAIDLGKYKSVVCIQENSGECRFATFDT